LKRNQPSEEGEFFIGARLAARRQKLSIPIEKAAADIRMTTSRLRSLETDDFSEFPHPTYARLYLIDYANYLKIPLEDIQAYLPSNKILGSTENGYLEVMLTKQNFMQSEQFKSLRRLLKFVGLGLFIILLIGAGIYFWRGWKKIERIKPGETSSLPTSENIVVEELPFTAAAPTIIEPPLPVTPDPEPTATPSLAQPYRYPATLATPQPSPATMILPPFEPAPRPKRPL
jgi:cytoskeletal protein RodZ